MPALTRSFCSSLVSGRTTRRLILALTCFCAFALRAEADPPTVTGVNPPSGMVDSTVVIHGNNFLPPLTVTFTGNVQTSGDFSLTQITVAVPAGAKSGPIVVTTSEGSASSGAFVVTTGSAPVVLPSVSFTASTPSTTAGSAAPGVVTVNLSAAASTDLTINYKVTGNAANGTDYTLLKGAVKVKAGKTSKEIKVAAKGNLSGAARKTVKLTLEPGMGYTVGDNAPVKVKINAGQ